MGVVFTNPNVFDAKDWKELEEADIQTCFALSLEDVEVQSNWDKRVTARAAAIGYSDATLGGLVRKQGDCGPDCIALSNLLDNQQQSPATWIDDDREGASALVRERTTSRLKISEHRVVTSMGMTIGLLHHRETETFSDFAMRMDRQGQFIEMPFIAAAAIEYNRPIVVVTGHGMDPAAGGYFMFSADNDAGFEKTPIVLLHRWGGNHFTLAIQVAETPTDSSSSGLPSNPPAV
jgi:hypothetical protein